MKLIHLLFIVGSCPAFAFTIKQREIVRKQFVDHAGPQFSAMVDAVLAKDYAFTDQQRLLCHIDASRFQCCPNSFSNTVTHETHHLNQRQHTFGIKDDPMSYVLTVSQNGSVIEDNFILPPLSPNQPWAAQILSPIRAVPVFASQAFLPVRVVPDHPIVTLPVASLPFQIKKKELRTLLPAARGKN